MNKHVEKMKPAVVKKEYARLEALRQKADETLRRAKDKIVALQKRCRHPDKAILRCQTSCDLHWADNYWCFCQDCERVFRDPREGHGVASCACARPRKAIEAFCFLYYYIRNASHSYH